MTPHDTIFDKIDELLARADARLAAILRAEPRGLVKVTGTALDGIPLWRWECRACSPGQTSSWSPNSSRVHDIARSHAHHCLGQDHGLEVAS